MHINEALVKHGFFRPQDVTENNYDVFLSKDATNSQNSPYISVCPLEGVFWSELHTIFYFCLCKILKRKGFM